MEQEDKLKEAKRLYLTANDDQRYVLESLFPELRESEDERIMEAIINTIEDCSAILSSENQKRMIAWLEKQGDKKWTDEDDKKLMLVIGYLEPIPDDFNFPNENEYQELNGWIDWLKSIRQRMEGRQ